ncbi:hypothetical protein VF21_06908 [Pseudogymnoascus sp. 05NY08]|nr:hypothetical protein VF21_06908 [Pseudogymnoascus sp. 05NY08]
MAGITSLPPEILSDILSYLPRKRDDIHKYPTNPPSNVSANLPVYATVCKAWQQHVESQTFREICVISCELEYWSKIMTESRRSALREIKYGIVISEDAEAAYSRGLRFIRKALEATERAFTAAITEFFVLLEKWEEHTPSMSLSLEITDFHFYSNGQLERKLRLKEIEYSSYLNAYCLSISLLDLINPDVQLGPVDDLPKSKSVTSLHLGQLSDQLHMTEDSTTRLAMKFPALKKLHLELGDMHCHNLVEPDFRYGMHKKFDILSQIPKYERA